MKKYIFLILLLCQSCAFFIKPPVDPKTTARMEPLINKTEEKGKPLKEKADKKPADKAEADEKPEQKEPKKPSFVERIEALMGKGDWSRARKLIDDKDFKGSKIKRELKSHIGLIEGFMAGYDRCVELEGLSWQQPKEALDCYLKLLEHNWNHLPRKSYFSKEFAVDLNAKKDDTLKRIKELRKKPEVKVKAKSKKKYKKPKKSTPREFFDSYYRCFKLERSSPGSLKEILGCYREAYHIQKALPRRVTYPQDVRMEIYTRSKTVSEKISEFSRKVMQAKEKESKQE